MDFILEVGTEPLPARFVRPAAEQLSRLAVEKLKDERLEFASLKTFATLNRLSLLVKGLAGKSETLHKEVSGPPARLWKDASGAYTPQAAGFARKQGVEPGKLKIISTPKGDFLSASVTIPGEAATKVLSRIIPEMIGALDFPKSMEWEATRFRFGRPIRSLLAVYGRKVVPFTLAGVKSGQFVYGRSRTARPVKVTEAGRYLPALKNLLVIADIEERKTVLLKRLETAARGAGGALDADPDLIDETVCMTEHPVAVTGSFKHEFLRLPGALLSTVLKKQLKFFPLTDDSGLMAYFIGVRDGVSEGQDVVRDGFERVLEARLSDAAFFISRDLRTELSVKLCRLEGVTFQRDLGSMAEKAERVRNLAVSMAEALPAGTGADVGTVSEIAKLAYGDLVTEVVSEFPELQGAMGGFYARKDGLLEAVARGVEQFYFPVGGGAPIPDSREAAVASLAGKADTLAGHFSVGNKPKGSADPFGLRRQATGMARIMLETPLSLDVEKIFCKALDHLKHPEEKRRGLLPELCEFVWNRAETLFADAGFRVDEIRSVRSRALSDLPRALERLKALQAVRRDPEFDQLCAAFKRAANILKQARFKDGGSPADRDNLKEAAEIALFDAIKDLEGKVLKSFGAGAFEEGFKELATLKPRVDDFFDRVMVMADDAGLREQRLRLLSQLVRLFNAAADLSELQPLQ